MVQLSNIVIEFNKFTVGVEEELDFLNLKVSNLHDIMIRNNSLVSNGIARYFEISGDNVEVSNITVINNDFSGVLAPIDFLQSSSLTISNVILTQNSIYSSSPDTRFLQLGYNSILRDFIFENNTIQGNGGVLINSNTKLQI
jgi:hypothetical protein